MSEVDVPPFMCIKTEKSSSFDGFASGKPCWLGIDEAGRGPVLGPMLYACAVSPIASQAEFARMGMMDSKALNDKKRTKLLEDMDDNPELVSYALIEMTAEYISAHMLSKPPRSLNQLSHNGAITLIQAALDASVNVTEVYVDTVGPKREYERLLRAHFPTILDITVAEKADATFAIVSAASIVAKVHRDRRLHHFRFAERHLATPPEGFGSGYPGDPCTKHYLLSQLTPVVGFNSLVRYSWKTAINALEKGAVPCKVLENSAQQSLHSFFHAKDGPPIVPRHQYFKDRKLRQSLNF